MKALPPGVREVDKAVLVNNLASGVGVRIGVGRRWGSHCSPRDQEGSITCGGEMGDEFVQSG